jgi:hypothetical protein
MKLHRIRSEKITVFMPFIWLSSVGCYVVSVVERHKYFRGTFCLHFWRWRQQVSLKCVHHLPWSHISEDHNFYISFCEKSHQMPVFCFCPWRWRIVVVVTVLDAEQSGWNTKRWDVLGLRWSGGHTVPVPWLKGKPILAI